MGSDPGGKPAPANPPEAGDGLAQFYIPATASILERRPRTLKHADSFAVFDDYGDIIGAPRSPEGLFHKDTRHLSRLELLINDHRLLLLSSTLQDDNALLTADLVNPDLYRGNRVVLSRESLHVVRSKFLWQGSCYERLALHNFDHQSHQIRLQLRFAVDFADLFEVRGAERERRGTARIEHPASDAVVMRYLGLDRVERLTRIDFAPTPTMLGDDHAVFELTLQPGQRRGIHMTVRCDDARPTERGGFFAARLQARREREAETARSAVVDSSNTVLNRVLCRSVADLYTLVTAKPEGPYPYAGIPWFSTAFGRDGIVTGLLMLWFDPEIAKGVLRFLADNQATAVDPVSEAEPGKILHETRQGEMARLGEVPFGLYYGSVDATPLFVLLAGRYFERTGDRATIKALWGNLEAALRWIDNYGDRDRDGFLEYHRRGDKGLANQGWKDSGDAISHADGTLAEGPIALAEVQAYVYEAKRRAAQMARALGLGRRSVVLEGECESLRERFEAAFWCEDLGTYALALDGAKQPCRVKTSNAGQVLFGGIASPDRAQRVAATLLGRDSFSGWGVRTLAAGERRYNPMSYHNGSVWPHDNALIALGFARYGLRQEVLRVFEGMFDAVQYMDLLRLPELFCGFSRQRGRGPTLYPIACSPQAWASATPLALLEACLGLRVDHARREIRFDRPMLPSFIDELRLRRLRLGDASVDILLRRHDTDVAVNLLNRQGDVQVVVVN